MTSCSAYRAWLSPYVDGRLEAAQRLHLETHLTGCSGCHEALASLQQMLATLRALETPAAPDLLPGIRRKLAAAPWWRVVIERVTAPWPQSLPWHGLAMATTALLVIMVARNSMVDRSFQAEKAGRLQHDDRGLLQDRSSVGVAPSAGFGSGGARANASRPSDDLGKAFRSDTPGSGEFPASSPSLLEGERVGVGGAPMLERTLEREAGLEGELGHLAGADAEVKPSQTIQGNTAVLELRWVVPDPTATATRIVEWIHAHEGLVVATTPTRLSIRLPHAMLPVFLQQWAPGGSVLPAVVEPTASWITLSLDLVSSQP